MVPQHVKDKIEQEVGSVDCHIEGKTKNVDASRLIKMAMIKGAEIALDWQPIETAPMDEVNILIANDRGICVASFDKDWGKDGWWLLDDGKNYEIPLRGDAPTHWMPLPEPPTITPDAQR